MRALVTGGGGFVGQWLVRHLRSSGDEVLLIDREVDITDGLAVRDAVSSAAPEAIYHLAAFTHVGRSWSMPKETLEVNAFGTLHVLEAARQSSPQARVLLISSSEVYGKAEGEDLPLSEGAPLKPVTPYAASKVAAEFLGLQAYLGHGLAVVRVRPFNHVGPGQQQSFAVPGLAARIKAALDSGARTIPVGNLEPRRDFTDVRDVVAAYRLLVLHGEPGEVYNVSSGVDVSIAEIASALVRLAGAQVELVVDPDLVRAVDLPVISGDSTRLRLATGWRPVYSLEDTLKDVLASTSSGSEPARERPV